MRTIALFLLAAAIGCDRPAPAHVSQSAPAPVAATVEPAPAVEAPVAKVPAVHAGDPTLADRVRDVEHLLARYPASTARRAPEEQPAPAAPVPAAVPAPVPQDLPKLEDVITKMEELSEKALDCKGKRLDTIGWRIFSKRGARFYTQEMGLELLGRFERGKGVRTQVTSLGCADATVHRQVAGPNHYVVIHEPHAVTIAPIMLIVESPDPNLSFPHLLLRAKKGDPEHAEIDPMLVPSALENLLYVNEPVVQFQIAPATMFGHEPGLRVAGRQRFAGKDCVVLQSERRTDGVGDRIPREWSAMSRETKRFFIDPATWLIEGMELDITRSNPLLPSGMYRDGYIVEVATRRMFGTVGLPEDTIMRPTAEARATGPREEAVHRTVQWQDGEFP